MQRAKTGKKAAIKLTNYAMDHWLSLPQYLPVGGTGLMLKTCYRQNEEDQAAIETGGKTVEEILELLK